MLALPAVQCLVVRCLAAKNCCVKNVVVFFNAFSKVVSKSLCTVFSNHTATEVASAEV